MTSVCRYRRVHHERRSPLRMAKKARFGGGQVVIITPPAEKLMQRHGIAAHQLLERHLSGDWGEQSDEDKKAWDRALENGLSLLSVYKVGGEEVWLMTDVGRLTTTFLTPEEHY